jgi:hypothetical protein
MSIMSGNLKLLAFIVGILSFAPLCIKNHYKWEDSQGPHGGTEAWHPHRQYSADVEEGLSILASTEPEEATYFHTRGYPIVFLPDLQGRMADTTTLGVIEIPRRFQGQPAQIAVVLSHEIVHEQRHDPFVTVPEYPLWRRLLWHQEEEVAHNKDLWVALKLWPKFHSVWNVLGLQWLIEPFFYLMVGPVCILAAAGLLMLIYSVWKDQSWGKSSLEAVIKVC